MSRVKTGSTWGDRELPRGRADTVRIHADTRERLGKNGHALWSIRASRGGRRFASLLQHLHAPRLRCPLARGRATLHQPVPRRAFRHSGQQHQGSTAATPGRVCHAPAGRKAAYSAARVPAARLTGWNLPAVGWVSLFVGTGGAIHSTYWHNNFGEPSSRGCINAAPWDEQWIFRWSQPVVPLEGGDITVQMPGGTPVKVQEAPD